MSRTTRLGADQYVLACSVRVEADDIAFANIERMEQDNQRLRADVLWRRDHGVMRTGNWVRGRVGVLVLVLAGIAGAAGWIFTPNGRELRVGIVQGEVDASANPVEARKAPHFITSDMTQREIDSIVAHVAAVLSRSRAARITKVAY
ncbi:MAG: hypothetical protein ABJE47_07475 [bacterium]